MVFYRKYRPQKLSELDSEEVRTNLATALSGKETPHAFLLSGPKGLGKTSAARIIAKIANCEKSEKIESCNKCDQCLSITAGTNLDILEIDAASNRGIDEIRSLREKITLAAARAKYKVYIIDEVHMLTNEAFNALLKTLEEPPSHALFILCTTELHKVPETIKSRCFPIVFKKANASELVRSLKRIVNSEKIHIDNDALLAIAKASDGSFRDASKILELASLKQGRKKITRDTIFVLVGNTVHVDEFVVFLKQKKTKELLLWLNESIDKGVNVKFLLEELLTGFHKGLLLKYDVRNGEIGSGIEGFSEEELKKLIQVFTKAHQELKTAVIPQLPVELAIIEYCTENSSKLKITEQS